MGKDTKTVVATPARKDAHAGSQPPRAMSLEKAKKLTRKTSDQHKVLFRRLAK